MRVKHDTAEFEFLAGSVPVTLVARLENCWSRRRFQLTKRVVLFRCASSASA